MSEFDSRARDWDKNPIHTERTEAIAKEIQKQIPLNASMKGMEFGAGTGLLSFALNKSLASITLIDNSKEMIEVTKEKIQQTGITNLIAIVLNLEHEDYPGGFDLIFSQMVFHHVENIGIVIGKFHAMLRDKGYVAIADLYPEDGSFHGDGFTGYKGFDPEQLGQKLLDRGFKSVKHNQCFVIKRDNGEGKIQEFPVFLLVAQK